MNYATVADIRAANKAIGHHFFDAATMRFFQSRASGPVVSNMFVTSERRGDEPRRFTIRRCGHGHIETVGEFQAYASKAAAVAEMRRIAKEQ